MTNTYKCNCGHVWTSLPANGHCPCRNCRHTQLSVCADNSISTFIPFLDAHPHFCQPLVPNTSNTHYHRHHHQSWLSHRFIPALPPHLPLALHTLSRPYPHQPFLSLSNAPPTNHHATPFTGQHLKFCPPHPYARLRAHGTTSILVHISVSRHPHQNYTAKYTLHITTTPLHGRCRRSTHQGRSGNFWKHRVLHFQRHPRCQQQSQLPVKGFRHRCHGDVILDHHYRRHGIVWRRAVRKHGHEDQFVRCHHHRHLHVKVTNQLHTDNTGDAGRLHHVNY